MNVNFPFKRLIGMAIVVSVATGSCSTANPYTGQKQVSKAGIGAGIGAVIGGLGGLLSSDKNKRRNALIGAGVGALAGGGIGYYMDQQEAKLRARLANSGVSVSRSGDRIVLNMPNNITFDVNRAELKPNFYEVLNSVSIVFNEFEKTLIDVEGHTDSDGTAELNLGLSQRRANSVARYLAAQRVNPQRFSVRGMGEERPIASNATSYGKARNRRVEIHISPLRAS